MKILIGSDSHRNIKYFYEVLEKEKPDCVIFAGDHSDDAIDLSFAYENIPFYIVRGNCDYYDDKTVDLMEINVDEIGKIIITHGHLYSVKSNLNNLYKMGVEKNADLVIFGHTHIRHSSEFKGIKFINPGAMINEEYAIYENGNIIFKGGR